MGYRTEEKSFHDGLRLLQTRVLSARERAFVVLHAVSARRQSAVFWGITGAVQGNGRTGLLRIFQSGLHWTSNACFTVAEATNPQSCRLVPDECIKQLFGELGKTGDLVSGKRR